MLPYVQVSHLPSSASFYSAVTHPLGLCFISASPGSVAYGTASPAAPSATTPAFEVRAIKDRTLDIKPARLVLSACSPSVVDDFYAAALRANPELEVAGGAVSHDPSAPSAQIQDLDGNIMSVVYIPPADGQARPGGSTVRRTQSTSNEASRILDWNMDVATSRSGTRAGSGSSTAVTRRPGDQEDPYVVHRRSVTTTSTVEAAPSPRESPSGLSSGGVIGTVLGAVAAGAAIGGALTYMTMRNQRENAPRQEFDAPVFQRRSTFPDPYPDYKPRYVERERMVEKIHYPDQYSQARGPRHYPPSAFPNRYPQLGGVSREVEELDDRSSRLSARQSAGGRTRTRSETGSIRRPLMITDVEHRSQAGSRHSTNLLPEADEWSRAPSKQSVPRSIRRDPEVETYLSSQSRRTERTDRSESTIRPSKQSVHDTAQPVTYGDIPIRSRAPSRAPTKASAAPSRHSTVQPPARSVAPSAAATKTGHPVSRTGSHVSARKVPVPGSHAGFSKVSARNIPLPESHADWDDNDSIAPSDSISCIGSRR